MKGNELPATSKVFCYSAVDTIRVPHKVGRAMSLDKNKLAEQLLNGVGFSCEPEPRWVDSGEVPDFFCSGPFNLWVEVKAVRTDGDFDKLSDLHASLQRRASAIKANGRAYASISEDATERELKAVIALVQHAMSLPILEHSERGRLAVMVPRNPDFARRVLITIEYQGVCERLFCVASYTAQYGRPIGWGDLPYPNKTTVRNVDGIVRDVDAYDLDLDDDNFLVCLVLERADHPFQIHGGGFTGGARQVTTKETIRSAAKKANSQFKNACRYRPAPSLLIVYQDGLLVQDIRAFAAAFYGDLQYSFRVGSFSEGRPVFGPNGIWTRSKNRSTSAACLIRNGSSPVMLRHPWAQAPLELTIFPWAKVNISEDGRVDFPEPVDGNAARTDG